MMRAASRGMVVPAFMTVAALACSPAQTPSASSDVTLAPATVAPAASASTPSASVAAPSASGTAPSGSVPDAGQVMASLVKGFRGCWVNESATTGGSAEATGNVKMVLDAEGRVASATATGFDNPSLASCLESVGLTAKFAAPGEGGATIVAPLRFGPSP